MRDLHRGVVHVVIRQGGEGHGLRRLPGGRVEGQRPRGERRQLRGAAGRCHRHRAGGPAVEPHGVGNGGPLVDGQRGRRQRHAVGAGAGIGHLHRGGREPAPVETGVQADDDGLVVQVPIHRSAHGHGLPRAPVGAVEGQRGGGRAGDPGQRGVAGGLAGAGPHHGARQAYRHRAGGPIGEPHGVGDGAPLVDGADAPRPHHDVIGAAAGVGHGDRDRVRRGHGAVACHRVADLHALVAQVGVGHAADGHGVRLPPALRAPRLRVEGQRARRHRHRAGVGAGQRHRHRAGGPAVEQHRVGGFAALLDRQPLLRHRHAGRADAGVPHRREHRIGRGHGAVAGDRVADLHQLVLPVGVRRVGHGHGLRRAPGAAVEGQRPRGHGHRARAGVAGRRRRGRHRHRAGGPAVEQHRVGAAAALVEGEVRLRLRHRHVVVADAGIDHGHVHGGGGGHAAVARYHVGDGRAAVVPVGVARAADGHDLRPAPVLRVERERARRDRHRVRVGVARPRHRHRHRFPGGGPAVQPHPVAGAAALVDRQRDPPHAEGGRARRHRHAGRAGAGIGHERGHRAAGGHAAVACDGVADHRVVVRDVGVLHGGHGHGLRLLPVAPVEGQGAAGERHHAGGVGGRRDRHGLRGPAVQPHRVGGGAALVEHAELGRQPHAVGAGAGVGHGDRHRVGALRETAGQNHLVGDGHGLVVEVGVHLAAHAHGLRRRRRVAGLRAEHRRVEHRHRAPVGAVRFYEQKLVRRLAERGDRLMHRDPVGGGVAFVHAQAARRERHLHVVVGVVHEHPYRGGGGDAAVAGDRVPHPHVLVVRVGVVHGGHGHGLRRPPGRGREGQRARRHRDRGRHAAGRRHRHRLRRARPAVQQHRVAAVAALVEGQGGLRHRHSGGADAGVGHRDVHRGAGGHAVVAGDRLADGRAAVVPVGVARGGDGHRPRRLPGGVVEGQRARRHRHRAGGARRHRHGLPGRRLAVEPHPVARAGALVDGQRDALAHAEAGGAGRHRHAGRAGAGIGHQHEHLGGGHPAVAGDRVADLRDAVLHVVVHQVGHGHRLRLLPVAPVEGQGARGERHHAGVPGDRRPWGRRHRHGPGGPVVQPHRVAGAVALVEHDVPDRQPHPVGAGAGVDHGDRHRIGAGDAAVAGDRVRHLGARVVEVGVGRAAHGHALRRLPGPRGEGQRARGDRDRPGGARPHRHRLRRAGRVVEPHRVAGGAALVHVQAGRRHVHAVGAGAEVGHGDRHRGGAGDAAVAGDRVRHLHARVLGVGVARGAHGHRLRRLPGPRGEGQRARGDGDRAGEGGARGDRHGLRGAGPVVEPHRVAGGAALVEGQGGRRHRHAVGPGAGVDHLDPSGGPGIDRRDEAADPVADRHVRVVEVGVRRAAHGHRLRRRPGLPGEDQRAGGDRRRARGAGQPYRRRADEPADRLHRVGAAAPFLDDQRILGQRDVQAEDRQLDLPHGKRRRQQEQRRRTQPEPGAPEAPRTSVRDREGFHQHVWTTGRSASGGYDPAPHALRPRVHAIDEHEPCQHVPERRNER